MSRTSQNYKCVNSHIIEKKNMCQKLFKKLQEFNISGGWNKSYIGIIKALTGIQARPRHEGSNSMCT